MFEAFRAFLVDIANAFAFMTEFSFLLLYWSTHASVAMPLQILSVSIILNAKYEHIIFNSRLLLARWALQTKV